MDVMKNAKLEPSLSTNISLIWFLSIMDVNMLDDVTVIWFMSSMDAMKNTKLRPNPVTNITLIWFLPIVDVNMLGWLYSDMVYLQYGCYEEHQVKAKPRHKHYTDMVSPHCGYEYARMTLQWYGLCPVWMLGGTPS